jgi:OHCU decarboxylase
MQDSYPSSYPRDLVGYGRNPPHADWPGGARVCLQFVLNYEEGGENNILHGDAASEAFLSEIVGAEAWPGQRHMNMESIYEYGSRAGFWRLYRIFGDRGVPLTVFAVAKALERNPEPIAAMKEVGWELASHGLKWIDYRHYSLEDERAHVLEAIRIHQRLTGERPLGFYQGRASEHSLRIVMEEGGFLYAADSYADDLPYWVNGAHGPQLVVPYTLDTNDMRFATSQGFNSGDQFFTYLKDSFDLLYAEGETTPKMLSIGLHSRLVGRPGRAAALARFLDYVLEREGVWIATRLDVAKHWIARHPPAGGYVPTRLSRALFVERFGSIFEHSPWVAQEAFDRGLGGPEADTAAGLARRMSAVVTAAPREKQLALINAHPDLSGRLAQAKLLTADSTAEQASAGLDQLTPSELARFTALNEAYKAKFGFVFIMAVRGRSKDEILQAFERRLSHSAQDEFREALTQIGRIAELRLAQILPA